jgi:hypothetical protein
MLFLLRRSVRSYHKILCSFRDQLDLYIHNVLDLSCHSVTPLILISSFISNKVHALSLSLETHFPTDSPFPLLPSSPHHDLPKDSLRHHDRKNGRRRRVGQDGGPGGRQARSCRRQGEKIFFSPSVLFPFLASKEEIGFAVRIVLTIAST